ncbi:MAG: hypothetical protein OFPI_21790 [Osedax symbiont Rs2]|nr:MAG: hypothetical protein OFPI_21790 [Osedax symbiont Rs2]
MLWLNRNGFLIKPIHKGNKIAQEGLKPMLHWSLANPV